MRALVRGRVQAVGFRVFVEHRATNLGLDGFVRNLSDGTTVEVVAEGTREALETLRELLRQGPSASYVESIDESWGKSSGLYKGFGQR